MRSERDTKEFRDMLENISSEYYMGEPSDNDFWVLRYNKVPFNRRLDNWKIIIDRYEYMVHAEFNEESVKEETKLIVRIIKDKDNNSKSLLSHLHDELLRRPLQNEDISEYMAKIIKELV